MIHVPPENLEKRASLPCILNIAKSHCQLKPHAGIRIARQFDESITHQEGACRKLLGDPDCVFPNTGALVTQSGREDLVIHGRQSRQCPQGMHSCGRVFTLPAHTGKEWLNGAIVPFAPAEALIVYVSFELLGVTAAQLLVLLFIFARLMPRLVTIYRRVQSLAVSLRNFQ